MSINVKQSVKCPKCGQMSEITVWHSITVKDSADLKNDLLSGKVNIFRCPSCETAALMPSPLLYHDEDRKLMISFSPCNDKAVAEKLYKDVKKASEESGELEKYKGYNLRFVTDYNELLEKILIFENDLNDKAIEVIKLMILSQDEEHADDRICRFGKAEGDSLEFMVQDVKENRVYTSRVPKETYETVYKSLLESGVKPYSFDWETVNSAYAAMLLGGSQY